MKIVHVSLSTLNKEITVTIRQECGIEFIECIPFNKVDVDNSKFRPINSLINYIRDVLIERIDNV